MDKSRQQFEEWVAYNAYLFMHINLTYHEAALYKLWQASRESLVVELPCKRGVDGEYDDFAMGWNRAIDNLSEILINNGVKVHE